MASDGIVIVTKWSMTTKKSGSGGIVKKSVWPLTEIKPEENSLLGTLLAVWLVIWTWLATSCGAFGFHGSPSSVK